MKLIDLIRTIEIPDIIPDKIIRLNSHNSFMYKIFPVSYVYDRSRYFLQEGNEEYVYSISNDNNHDKFLFRIGYKKTRAIYYSLKPKKELILEDLLLDLNEDESYLALKYGKFLLDELEE